MFPSTLNPSIASKQLRKNALLDLLVPVDRRGKTADEMSDDILVIGHVEEHPFLFLSVVVGAGFDPSGLVLHDLLRNDVEVGAEDGPAMNSASIDLDWTATVDPSYLDAIPRSDRVDTGIIGYKSDRGRGLSL